MSLDEELNVLDEIEFYRVVEEKINIIKKLKQMPTELDFLTDDQLMENFIDPIFGGYYRMMFDSRQRHRSEIISINTEMKRAAVIEMKKYLK